MQTITVQELKKNIEKDGNHALIDVREPFEYETSHIPDAKNIPLGNIAEAAESLRERKHVYLYCTSGGRSAQAALLLEKQGISAANLGGGIDAWRKAGFELAGTGKNAAFGDRKALLFIGVLLFVCLVVGFILFV